MPTAIDRAAREIAPSLTPAARTLAERLERFVSSTTKKLAARLTFGPAMSYWKRRPVEGHGYRRPQPATSYGPLKHLSTPNTVMTSNLGPQGTLPGPSKHFLEPDRFHHDIVTDRLAGSMSSNSSLWQARWEVFPIEGLAVHESGLRVRLQDGQAAAENPTEIADSFVPAHGSHNAPAMVRRLTREGTKLLVDPHSRGWRGGTKSR